MLKVVGASWTTSRVCWMIVGGVIIVILIFIINWELERTEEDGNYSATIFWSEESGYSVELWGQGMNLIEVPEGVVRAVVRPNIKQTGWAELELESQAKYSDEVQAFAAGYLEGSISWQMIYHQWLNTVHEACANREHFCRQVRSYLRNNTDAVRSMAELYQHEDPFWHQVFLYHRQLDGIRCGWQSGMSRTLSEFKAVSIPDDDFLWLNIASDLPDLERMFNGSYEATYSPLAFSPTPGLSTAFVKVLPENKDLFVAHNSAGLYRSMLRVLKRYQLRYHETAAPDSPLVPGFTVEFSSYPGAIHSQDDVYHVSGRRHHRLAVAGTPISNFNTALWACVNPRDQVLLGPRVMAANRLATSGKLWGHQLGRHNSGTGNKQWLVVDASRITHYVKKGLLVVVEQLPGHVHVSDHSHLLWNQGYFAVHGLPYHQDVRVASGTTAMEKRFGSEFSSQDSAVARIFRRDHVNASDVASIQHLMRSNAFLDDPFSGGSPLHAAAARGDVAGMPNSVVTPSLRPLGTTDVKVLSLVHSSRSFQLHAVAGPTFQSYLPPFQWSSSRFQGETHIGHPDLWDFNSVQPSWAWRY